MAHPLKKLLLPLFLWSSLYLPAQTVHIEQITEHCYAFTTWGTSGGQQFPANGIYIIGREHALVIDPPWDTTQTYPLLDSIYARHKVSVLMSISTHFHDDRTASVPLLQRKGTATWCSALTRRYCLEKGEAVPRFSFVNDTVFRLDGLPVETYYPGPGHSPDNIVIWFAPDRLLYGGCFIKSTESPHLGNLSDADVPSWRSALQRVQKKFPHPRYVLPGHFGWKNKNQLRHTSRLVNNYLRHPYP